MRILHTQLIRTRRLHSQPVISMNVSAAAAPRAWRYVAVNPFRHDRNRHWSFTGTITTINITNQQSVPFCVIHSKVLFILPIQMVIVWSEHNALHYALVKICSAALYTARGLLSKRAFCPTSPFCYEHHLWKKRNEVWISLSSRLNWVIYVPMSLLLVIIICHMCLYWDEINPRV